jgi:hypothetical protein
MVTLVLDRARRVYLLGAVPRIGSAHRVGTTVYVVAAHHEEPSDAQRDHQQDERYAPHVQKGRGRPCRSSLLPTL